MTTAIRSNYAEISVLIAEGIDKWLEAGRLVADALSRNPASMDKICQATGLSPDIITRFEQIGKEELYPQLLASTSIGARNLVKCSYSQQKHYSANPIAMLVSNGDKPDKLMVAVDAMTGQQVKQVFGRGHIRSLAEQRAWVESERESIVRRTLADKAEIQEAAFVIKGKRCVFKKGAELTAREIADILAKMS